ncbi:MAG TPA: peptide-methionine (R)-S-oxide reductase MsrB [Phycisphaerae bacterium]|nr:peptide-methionine (R)-S-oxide reductase MsrB [Phycisphaerae bacterium]
MNATKAALLSALAFAALTGCSNEAALDTKGKIVKTEAEWRAQLTDEQYRVTRLKETEPAFTGAYWNVYMKGIYRCACCDQPLFDSETKFDSGSGWPSFWAPIAENRIATRPDRSDGMDCIEIMCSRCDAHLGHLFKDGPKPTGLRYCANSAALKLERKE